MKLSTADSALTNFALSLTMPCGLKLRVKQFSQNVCPNLTPLRVTSMSKLLNTTSASLFILCASLSAHAASFNCGKATTADEKAICADRVLNDKDVSMALLYDIDRHLMGMGARGSLMDDQADWLKRRRACGANIECLTSLYDQRIGALRKFIDERVATHGPF